MAATLTINGITSNAGSLVNAELVVSGVTWRSPSALTHLYSTSVIPMMLDQDNAVLYIHDESGQNLVIFTDEQANGVTVTDVGVATSAADLYSKLKQRYS